MRREAHAVAEAFKANRAAHINSTVVYFADDGTKIMRYDGTAIAVESRNVLYLFDSGTLTKEIAERLNAVMDAYGLGHLKMVKDTVYLDSEPWEGTATYILGDSHAGKAESRA